LSRRQRGDPTVNTTQDNLGAGEEVQQCELHGSQKVE
jgi:hypothetical protein